MLFSPREESIVVTEIVQQPSSVLVVIPAHTARRAALLYTSIYAPSIVFSLARSAAAFEIQPALSSAGRERRIKYRVQIYMVRERVSEDQKRRGLDSFYRQVAQQWTPLLL